MSIEKHRPPLGQDVVGFAGRAAKELATLRTALASLPDSEILALAKEPFRGVTPAALSEDELGQMLQGLAALQRTRSSKPDAAFDRAFDLLRQKNWQDSRAELKILLGVVAQPKIGGPP
jgi:hypothetical protein